MNRILCILLFTFLISIFGCLPKNTEEYIKDLKSENLMVRSKAIYHLGKKKKKGAVPILIDLLKHDQAKDIKISAIEALGKIGEETSVDELISVLKHNDNDIRIAACNALGNIRDPKAIRPLIRVLPDKDIQLSAIWALGNIGDQSAVPALSNLLNNQNKYVSYNAAQSLKKIGCEK